MNKECDHIIADDNGKLIRVSDFYHNRFNDVLDYCPTCKRCEEDLQPFVFCPECGKKIDWDNTEKTNKILEKARDGLRKRVQRNPIADIIGKWPGDESDAEFDAMMREHEEKD